MREEKNKESLSHRCLESKERVKNCKRPRNNPSLTASKTERKKRNEGSRRKVKRKEGQVLTDIQEGKKKKKARKFAKKEKPTRAMRTQ